MNECQDITTSAIPLISNTSLIFAYKLQANLKHLRQVEEADASKIC
jgi:hypothetical protein